MSMVIAPEAGSKVTFTNIWTPQIDAEANIALDDLKAIPDDVIMNTGLATLYNAHIDEYNNNGKVTLLDPNAWEAQHIAAIRLYNTANSYIYLNPGDSVEIIVRSSAEALYYIGIKDSLLKVEADFITDGNDTAGAEKTYGLYLSRTTGLGDESSIKFDSDEVTAELLNELFTVTFNANGHGTAPAAEKVRKGDTATQPGAPTAEGFTFGGWYTDAECTKSFSFSTEITEDITLYAKWTEQ